MVYFDSLPFLVAIKANRALRLLFIRIGDTKLRLKTVKTIGRLIFCVFKISNELFTSCGYENFFHHVLNESFAENSFCPFSEFS